MKAFTICCTIRGVMCNLRVTAKRTQLTQFFVYDGRRWLCTLSKGINEKYKVISSGVLPPSITELESLGGEIDLFEKATLETI